MKAVLQRVSEASVSIDGNVTGSIEKGFLVLLGIGENDDKFKVRKMADKIQKLRIFQDDNGKTNLSSADAGGELLVVSQFTLYADCRKGNRPSFENAAKPQLAEELYNYFIEYSRDKFKKTAAGVFGGDMKVSLINDGPFTVILEV